MGTIRYMATGNNFSDKFDGLLKDHFGIVDAEDDKILAVELDLWAKEKRMIIQKYSLKHQILRLWVVGAGAKKMLLQKNELLDRLFVTLPGKVDAVYVYSAREVSKISKK